MSIVLVIIGLIVGGVLTGRELIKSAKISKIVSRFNEYQTAVNSFQDKFGYLPGDFPDAITHWPSLSGGAGSAAGNGNGYWDDPIYEGLGAWRHLSHAGMIKEDFTYTGYQQYVTGSSLPETQYGTRWHFITQTITYYGRILISGNALKISDGNGTANSHWHFGIGPVDAKLVDIKMDDGKALHGRLIGYSSSNNVCIDRANPNADYYLDRTALGCQLSLKLY